MGVIRNGANGKDPFNGTAASYDVLDGFNSHDEGEEPVELVVHVHHSSLLEPRRRAARRSMPACGDVLGLSSRGKHRSTRKVRRLDNERFLHTLAEEDEDAAGQLSIDDFVHQSVSAFSRLLADLDNHEVWDEVLNCKGQVQPLAEDQEPDEIADEVTSSLPTSGGCFQRLDAALRNLLRKQRVPLATTWRASAGRGCETAGPSSVGPLSPSPLTSSATGPPAVAADHFKKTCMVISVVYCATHLLH
ncbi:uncharacterized protein LOC142560820 isoform X2 [Dermacentor variabilis]|uniref:uncharacterized protein LOC142560820 isoform X2 n=1 Tax=Dermacentor variabilis TaxID=34621 RepID=UPI003F5AEB6E